VGEELEIDGVHELGLARQSEVHGCQDRLWKAEELKFNRKERTSCIKLSGPFSLCGAAEGD
jgi:hypothetical protein